MITRRPLPRRRRGPPPTRKRALRGLPRRPGRASAAALAGARARPASAARRGGRLASAARPPPPIRPRARARPRAGPRFEDVPPSEAQRDEEMRQVALARCAAQIALCDARLPAQDALVLRRPGRRRRLSSTAPRSGKAGAQASSGGRDRSAARCWRDRRAKEPVEHVPRTLRFVGETLTVWYFQDHLRFTQATTSGPRGRPRRRGRALRRQAARPRRPRPRRAARRGPFDGRGRIVGGAGGRRVWLSVQLRTK